MVTGLVVYLTNFMMGRAKNARLAQAWFQSHKSLLEENFVLVGESLSNCINFILCTA